MTAPDSPVLLIGGLDLLDGTPVFDVKPYLPYAEAVPQASGGFAGDAIARMPVEVEPGAEENFRRLPSRSRAVLLEALSLDPRPATRSEDSDRVFGASLCGCNVRFSIGEGICRILEITPAEASGLNA